MIARLCLSSFLPSSLRFLMYRLVGVPICNVAAILHAQSLDYGLMQQVIRRKIMRKAAKMYASVRHLLSRLDPQPHVT